MSAPTQLGNEWLRHALSCEPADRDTAEKAITSVYALINEPEPSFIWVNSPRGAASILPPAPPPAPVRPPWSLESRIATVIHEMREGMGRKVIGEELRAYIDGRVRDRLRWIVRQSIADVLRDELATRLGLYWYGQQEADWIAHFDTCRRLGIVHFRRTDVRRLDMSDEQGRLRLHHESGPAIVYPDGWALYSWHGTHVPSWVIEDPTAARIAEEANIEIRRCAIEHIGWAELRRTRPTPEPNCGSTTCRTRNGASGRGCCWPSTVPWNPTAPDASTARASHPGSATLSTRRPGPTASPGTSTPSSSAAPDPSSR
jgi:hypothetical protein